MAGVVEIIDMGKKRLPPGTDISGQSGSNVIFLVLVALFVKLFLLFFLSDSAINNDGMLYITAAKYYKAGNFSSGLALYPMPMYPLFLAGLYHVIPDWILCGYIISIISMTLATMVLYCVTKELFGIRAAFWASLLFAVLPQFNRWALYISRDALFLLVFGACVYFSLRSFKENKSIYFISTFAFAALSILIRIEGVLFFFLYFCALLFLASVQREQRRLFVLRAFLWAGIPALAMAAVIAMVGVQGVAVNRFDQLLTEIASLFNGGVFIKYLQIYDFFSEAEKHPPFSVLRYNFAALTRHYMPIIYLLAIAEGLTKALFALSVIPLYIGLRLKTGSSGIWILILVSAFLLLVLYSLVTRDFIRTRFFMVPAFFLLPWVGLGLKTLMGRCHNVIRKKMLLLLVLSVFIVPAARTIKQVFYIDNTVPLAAKWLAESGVAVNDKIVVNDEQALFYFNIEFDRLSDDRTVLFTGQSGAVNGIEAFALQNDADFVILKTKDKAMQNLPRFKFFKQIRSFEDRRSITRIYASH